MGKCTIALLLFISAILRVAHLQAPIPRSGVASCEIPSLNDFGSMDAAGSNEGIVSGFFGGGDAGIVDPQTIRIVAVNRVCEASGLTRDTLGSISVIVQYECLDSQCGGMGSTFIDQYRLDCIETDGVASFSGVTSGDIRTAAIMVVGNLTTPLMNQCGRCVLPSGLFMSDPATYCLACDGCVGLGMCLDSTPDHCCNYYNGDNCVITCPGSLVPNAQFECDCGLLPTVDNVEIVYSDSQFEGSTATETCISENGYIRSGTDPVTDFEAATASVVRTCTELNGWEGIAITCSLYDCGTTNLQSPENGQFSADTTVFGSVATFTCDTGFNLVNGDARRTCQLSGWSGTNPTCEPEEVVTQEPTATGAAGSSSPCGTGCIVGIVLAVLGAIILAAILVGVAYAIYTYMNHPDTKLAKYDPDNLNGVAKDNPLYVDPDAVVGAEAA